MMQYLNELSGLKLIAVRITVVLALCILFWKVYLGPALESTGGYTPTKFKNKKWFHWWDAAILLALAVPMFFIMKLGVTSPFSMSFLYHISVISPLIACAALFAVWLCALIFDSTLACFLLGLVAILGAVGKPASDSKSLSYVTNRQKIEEIEFQLVDPIDNAELTINGVEFGKLPLRTTYKELLAKIPEGYSPPRFAKNTDTKEFNAKERGYLQTTSDTISSYNKENGITIHFQLCQYEEENSLPTNSLGAYQKIWFKVNVGDTPAYIRSNDNRGVSADEDGVTQVFLELKFQESEQKFVHLINHLKLEGYQPSKEWLAAFSTFGRQGLVDLKELARSDKELLPVVDAAIKDKFGISKNLSKDEAWEVLKKLQKQADLAGEFDWKMSEYAAAKLLAPYLDPDQVITELMATMKSSDEISITLPKASKKRVRRKKDFPLEVLTYVASLMDEDLDEKSPDQYNIFETQFGDKWFVKHPPQPSSYTFKDVLSFLERSKITGSKEKMTSGMRSLVRMGYQAFNKFRAPLFGSPMADQFVLHQAVPGGATAISRTFGDEHWVTGLAGNLGMTIPMGDKESLGSVEVDRWQKEILFLDTPVGQAYRKEHEKEILELAIRSLGPIEKGKVDPRDKNLNQVINALQSSLNQSFVPNFRWPLPHLEFLFLDAKNQTKPDPNKPSLAMKFWPYFDSMLEAQSRIAQIIRLKARWLYLARIWPESTPEMFADAYFKTDASNRQRVIAGRFRTGLPDTIPVHSRLEIFNLIKDRAKDLPAGVPPEKIFYYQEDIELLPKNEVESIKRAIAKLDCKEAADVLMDTVFTKFLEEMDLEKVRSADPYTNDALQRLSCRLHGLQWIPLDYRVEALANHADPKFRQIAIAMIRQRSTQRLASLLKELKKDKDPDVKSFALEVDAELNKLLATPLRALSLY